MGDSNKAEKFWIVPYPAAEPEAQVPTARRISTEDVCLEDISPTMTEEKRKAVLARMAQIRREANA